MADLAPIVGSIEAGPGLWQIRLAYILRCRDWHILGRNYEINTPVTVEGTQPDLLVNCSDIIGPILRPQWQTHSSNPSEQSL